MHHQQEPLGYPGAAEAAMSAAPKQNKPEAEAPKTVLTVGEEIPDGAGGRFIILGLIGKGGMGEVYRAEWWKHGAEKCEIVAIKVMLGKNADDPKALMRFNFEAEALKDIRHPNVVPVLAMGAREDGLLWMAMPLLRGKTLHEVLEKEGKLPIPWALAIIRDVCRGMGPVHSIAIHRDIKPANLFLCVDGVVKILDLGASKFLDKGLLLHTTTGFQVGTLPYMSPEQIRNQTLDERSDLFSLIVVLYQMLTSRHPFDFGGGLPGWFETCSRIVDKPHVPPDEVAPWLPRHIVEILNKGLAKEPSRRFRDADELRDVLTAALNQLAADMAIDLEPLTTFAATLAPREEAPPSPAPMPRTTVPMSPPADARPHGEQDTGPSSSAPQPRAATPLPYAATDKVPEVPEVPEHDDGFSTWSRPAMLPAEVDVPRVSRVATKRPEPGGSPPASVQAEPAREIPSTAPLRQAASNDVTPEENEDEKPSPSYIELLARVINELPDELRLPFVWSRIRKRPLDEIAERTGVPAATVHQRVLVAEAAVKAEMERRLPGGHDAAGAPVPVAEKAGEPKDVKAPEVGPKGTVKMIESAATLLAKQGKTLEQVRAEASAAARSEADDQPTPQPNVSRQGRGIVLAAALVVALVGGGAAALPLLRDRAVGAVVKHQTTRKSGSPPVVCGVRSPGTA
jgi:serine/threonine-protein kinase